MLDTLLRTLLGLSRCFAIVAVGGILAASVPLLFCERPVASIGLVEALDNGSFSSQTAKRLAVGPIETLDIFLIAIVAHTIGPGLQALFVDPDLPRPRWLKVCDLDDLKSPLASNVIAMFAVLFMRDAVAWAGESSPR
jgi:uncharacterized membrane protein YqhA